jgi:hypothetical protein
LTCSQLPNPMPRPSTSETDLRRKKQNNSSVQPGRDPARQPLDVAPPSNCATTILPCTPP